jgi:hypothetical protein
VGAYSRRPITSIDITRTAFLVATGSLSRARTQLARTQRVGQPQLDECLPRHADSLRLTINRLKEINREVDIHTLDLTARPAGVCEVKVRGEVFPRVVHFVETSGGQRLSLRGTALLRLSARGGPR